MNLFFLKDRHGQKTFAQCGEDIIVAFIFYSLKIDKPTYFDIGTNHPIHLNNTYYFYNKGSSGICIEPDPDLFPAIKRTRGKDICLNAGIGIGEETEANFYVMSTNTLNTFCQETALRYASYGKQQIKKVIPISLITISEISKKYFVPDFISLDVEGYELSILKSIDFNILRPKVFCIETLSYTEDKTEKKLDDIIDYMLQQRYFVYADTYINTIFVDESIWKNR